MLAFDSKAVAHLFQDDHQQYFSAEYPIIYKNKVRKKGGVGFYYLTAIDQALKTNQVKAVNEMIQYIVKYQNNFVSSYLFLHNLPVLMEKSISIKPILNSDIFTMVFDLDKWPGNHTNDEECIRFYKQSFYKLHENYETVFPEAEFGLQEKVEDNSKVFKIKYSINLLPQVDFHITNDGEHINDHISFMSLCSDSEEIEIFQTDSLQQLIEFKWVSYGRFHHFFGCMMHLFYTGIFALYVNNACLKENEKWINNIYAAFLLLGILYPMVYDMAQMYKAGISVYFSDTANYADFIYIWGSVGNAILQIVYDPFQLPSRIIMCIIVCLLICKTFFFLRIFPTLTPIVVMLTNVIWDLRIFLFFYVILILLFSQLFAVLGLGNAQLRTDLETQAERDALGANLAGEYQTIGLHVGEFMWTLRLSMGDFSAIGESTHLQKAENIVFWLLWGLTVIVTCVIFLNFIVAEASASYTAVTETLDEVI